MNYFDKKCLKSIYGEINAEYAMEAMNVMADYTKAFDAY